MAVRDPEELVRLNLGLRATVLPGGRFTGFGRSAAEELPRAYLYRTDRATYLFCHDGLDPLTVRALQAIGPAALFRDPALARSPFEAEARVARPWLGAGPAFEGLYFAADPPAPDRQGVEERRGGFDLRVGGRRASRAFSSMENRWAAELAVRTEPEFRRRGLARRVSSAWAHAVLATGRVAFYTHIRGNEESDRLARSLGVTHYASSQLLF